MGSITENLARVREQIAQSTKKASRAVDDIDLRFGVRACRARAVSVAGQEVLECRLAVRRRDEREVALGLVRAVLVLSLERGEAADLD